MLTSTEQAVEAKEIGGVVGGCLDICMYQTVFAKVVLQYQHFEK